MIIFISKPIRPISHQGQLIKNQSYLVLAPLTFWFGFSEVTNEIYSNTFLENFVYLSTSPSDISQQNQAIIMYFQLKLQPIFYYSKRFKKMF